MLNRFKLFGILSFEGRNSVSYLILKENKIYKTHLAMENT